MSSNFEHDPDEKLESLLAAYDDSLAKGCAAPAQEESLSREAPQLGAEFAELCECLRQLEKKWPRSAALMGAQIGPESEDLLSFVMRESGELSRFEIQRRLGQGGYGVVFLAFDTLLRRQVALKLPRPDSFLSAGLRQRFLQEARATAALKHPNLITVYDAGEAGPLCYIAEAYCEGPNLSDWLKEQTEPVSPHLAADLLRTLAEAVAYAHARGIIHRDLKPSNVLLDPKPKPPEGSEPDREFAFTPKVTDFGLAKSLDPEWEEPGRTLTFSIVGTAAYMAPEQAEGKHTEVGFHTDVYALGVLLYELLARQTPFQASTLAGILRQIIAEDPIPIRRMRPEVPADLETICFKCLEKRPTRRYQTADDLALDLNRFLRGEPTLARPLGIAARTAKWVRRRPALAAILAVCALAAALFSIGGWWYTVRLQLALDAADSARAVADREKAAALRQEALAREREGQIRRYLYAADLRQAFGAWNNSHLTEMVELLERHGPKSGADERPGFAWHYLWGLCHSEQRTLVGHSGEVLCVAYSPDGRLLATGSDDCTVKIWDAASGHERLTLRGHGKDVDGVAFSPDGLALATAGEDGTVRLWKVATGALQATLTPRAGTIWAVAFSPDGKRLASGGEDQLIRLWDPATGREQGRLRGHRGRIRGLAFSADGSRLATASGDGDAKVWNVGTGQVQATVVHRWPDGSQSNLIVNSAAFSHDGRLVATGADDRIVKISDASSGVEKTILRGHSEVAQCVAFSPDDRTLAAALKDGTVWLWDLATGTVRATIRAHNRRIWQAAFSPDGKRLATASSDRTTKVWAADGEQDRRKLLPLTPSPVVALAFTADGKQVVANAEEEHGRNGLFCVWDIASPAAPARLRPGLRGGLRAFSADGLSSIRFEADPAARPPFAHDKLLYASAGKWEERPVLLHDPEGRHLPNVSRLSLSPDHRTIATADKEGRVRLWNLPTGTEGTRLATHLSNYVKSLGFSPDGRSLAAVSADGVAKIWDVSEGRELSSLRVRQGGGSCLAFSPDGKLLAVGGERTITLWNHVARSEPATLQGHASTVRCLAFSPDCRTLASGSDDGAMKLWDLRTFQELISLVGHQEGVRVLTFSPNGQLLATAGATQDNQGEVFLWSAEEQR